MSLTKAVARGVGYPLLVVLGVLLLPVTLGVAVATNYRGTAERFSGIPGVSADGSVLSGSLLGLVALALVASVVAGAVVVTSGGIPGGDVVGGDPTPTDSPVSPTETPTATPSATPTAESNVDQTTFRFCNSFEDALRDSTDLGIREVTTDGTNCQLEYVQNPRLSEEQISRNISAISGVYLSAVNHTEGGHPDRLEVDVVDNSNRVFIEYYIKTIWARMELNGEISTTEYANKTHETTDIGS